MQLELLITVIGLALWLLIVSYYLVKVYKISNLLMKDVGKGNLLKVLDKVLKQGRVNKKSVRKIEEHLSKMEEDALTNVQKVGLIRFNPFKELGGDHSFVLSLLDGTDSGIIITGLHTRERTRVYVKEVNKGKSNMELSAEEKKSLKLAKK